MSTKNEFAPIQRPGGNLMKQAIGQRLAYVRGRRTQEEFAGVLGVHKNTYGGYERGANEIGALALVSLYLEGWDLNWLLTGEGRERLDAQTPSEKWVADHVLGAVGAAISQSIREQDPPPPPSQPVRPDALKLAVELASEALEGLAPRPEVLAELTALVYAALVNGLPSADVLAFARPAARGLATGGPDESRLGDARPPAAGPRQGGGRGR